MGEYSNSKLLVIDDDPALRESVAGYLEDSDFTVLRATNGAEGLELFREHNPDLILLDLRMPVLDGIEALPIIVKESPDTPVIIVSGMGTLDDAIEALRLGAWDFITKPVHDLAFLEHSVRRALERASLIEENKRYREHLEDEVVIRTQELSDRNADLENSRHKIEQAARDWDDAFNAVLDPLFIHDETFKIVNANTAYYQRAGLSRENVIGRVYWEIFPRIGEPIAGCQEAIDKIGSEKAFHDIKPVEVRLDSGEIFISHAYTIHNPDDSYKHSLHILQDITERKKTQEALRDSEERYRLIFEQSGDSIVLVDPDNGNISEFNEQAYLALGYTRDEYSRLSINDIEATQSPEKVRNEIEKIVEGGMSTFSTQHIAKNGDLRDVLVSARLLVLNNKSYIQAVFTDFTERKKAEEERRRSIERLHSVSKKTIQAIALTVEKRDPYTAGHQVRAADLAASISQEMGLDYAQSEGIRLGATIHDIGKVSVPSEFLSRPGKLGNNEMEIIKTHSKVGYDIVKDIDFDWPVAEMILQHHERMDGSGYPNGLTGEEIIIEAKIMAVADVVEAMSSHRPYRPSLGIDSALGEITEHRGTLYDEAVVDACLRLFNEKGYEIDHPFE